MNRFLLCSLVSALLLFGAASAEGADFRPAPQNAVPDVYLVTLRKEAANKPGERKVGRPPVEQVVAQLGDAYDGTVMDRWDHVRGFLVRMPEARARQLADDPRVLRVEQDYWISASVGGCYDSLGWDDTRPALPSPTGSTQTITCSDPNPASDPNPGDPLCKDNWGLDRIDQADVPRNAQYGFTNNGTDVHVYVLDTGIQSTHREFLNASGVSRVAEGFDATGAGARDCIGHGTHVASILAGRTFGVAKNAILHSVKIIDCTEQLYLSRATAGLAWILANAKRPAIVNYSGANAPQWSSTENSVRDHVKLLIDAGIVVVQSAGNQSPSYTLQDACDLSFGRVIPDVIVAGGLDENEGRWVMNPPCSPGGITCGSNSGACVDIWAPSSFIVAAKRDPMYDSPTLLKYACSLSGTSMAAPHVAGVAAIYLQTHPAATSAEVTRALRSRGHWNKLRTDLPANDIGTDADNVILHSDTRTTGSSVAPAAHFTVSCAGRVCTFDARTSCDDPGALTYAWSFGGSTAQIQHTFPEGWTGDKVVLQVTDDAGLTDHYSQTVQPNATPNCDVPFLCHPKPGTINLGSSTPLVVKTTGTGVSFQWYVGAKGDTSQPVSGATTESYTFGASTTMTAGRPWSDLFWVRATGSCPTRDSDASIVEVLGGGPAGALAARVHSVAAGWRMVGAGDFNGDKYDDVLLQNNTSGNLVVWTMQRSAVLSTENFLGTQPISTAWRAVLVADFNADGIADILLQNSSNNLIYVWTMNKNFTVISTENYVGQSGAGWSVVASGDLNNDGSQDLVLSNTNNQNEIWKLSGTTYVSTHSLPNRSTNWNIFATADVSGDGNRDLVLRHATTGANAVWTLVPITGGYQVTSTEQFLPTLSNANWRIVSSADFNRDGKPDLLWQSNNTDESSIWHLNQYTIVSP